MKQLDCLDRVVRGSHPGGFHLVGQSLDCWPQHWIALDAQRVAKF
jgi:hypothetical protein